MTTDHDAWLALTVEDPIEPDLLICDPHHHLWDYPASRYLLDELRQDIGSGHNLVQTVFVECSWGYKETGPEAMRPVGETEQIEAIAQMADAQGEKTKIAAGIVGFADLTLGAQVAPVLEAHLAASPNRFRGIRHSAAWDASPDIRGYKNPPQGLLLADDFRQGFAYLQQYNLSFEAWLYHPQLRDLVDLAGAFPDTTIILNHIGGPIGIGPYAGQRAAILQTWQAAIAALAACPNVVVKLGGLGMKLGGFGWSKLPAPPNSAEMAEAMAPYYLWCIEQFGVDRCMFESNFPVDKTSSSYAVLWNAFKRIVQDFSPAEKAALFHDTAVRVYRLSSESHAASTST